MDVSKERGEALDTTFDLLLLIDYRLDYVAQHCHNLVNDSLRSFVNILCLPWLRLVSTMSWQSIMMQTVNLALQLDDLLGL